ncbi:hypothetical protein BO71DRAFT_422481 [Aspergillus ellipticus CBS 707.79]|uniref:Uncharacterized protein n=1 Tax=Aspergillus ellipticus CBS 707.79 TaxID=1448320 RepID=A0A319DPY0_9EURO|nr:hypothetical protein BO71DRAFT_422481 [Aspergillus ellipticus CBS 707.79]
MSNGKSLALSQNSFLQPPDARAAARDADDELAGKRQKRHATLFDAVAGRVNSHGFLTSGPYPSKRRDNASSSNRPVPPEEVLFRRVNAPDRFEETDFYFANESLPPHCALPSSELLGALHAYSADFYEHATIDRGHDDYHSLDETALVAMGILLEEMAKESLGETGDMVLVEGEEIPADEERLPSRVGRQMGRKRANTGQSMIMPSSGDDLEPVSQKRRPKKRKLGKRDWRADTTDMDTEADEGRGVWA